MRVMRAVARVLRAVGIFLWPIRTVMRNIIGDIGIQGGAYLMGQHDSQRRIVKPAVSKAEGSKRTVTTATGKGKDTERGIHGPLDFGRHE
jgi:hypothetical protein